jgi:hypothetical protein
VRLGLSVGVLLPLPLLLLEGQGLLLPLRVALGQALAQAVRLGVRQAVEEGEKVRLLVGQAVTLLLLVAQRLEEGVVQGEGVRLGLVLALRVRVGEGEVEGVLEKVRLLLLQPLLEVLRLVERVKLLLEVGVGQWLEVGQEVALREGLRLPVPVPQAVGLEEGQGEREGLAEVLAVPQGQAEAEVERLPVGLRVPLPLLQGVAVGLLLAQALLL